MLRLILATFLVTSALGAPQSAMNVLNLGGRIVGGTNTTIEDHPYIVSLLQSGEHYCGGSILSATWILTAAHCILQDVSVYSIRTGSTIRNSGGQVISASKIIIHESYNNRTIDYDIALIQLVSPITNSVARAIALAGEEDLPAPDTIATVTDWGSLIEKGPHATVLQVIQMPIVSQDNCQRVYGTARVTDRMLCAGLLEVGGKDACSNDSGGPLITNGVLTGVVSWGKGCARPFKPGVYASVPNLRAWIRNNSGI